MKKMQQATEEQQAINAESFINNKQSMDLSVATDYDQSTMMFVSEADKVLSIIDKMSCLPDLNMDNIERMFKLYNSMVDKHQQQLYNESMSLAQAEMQPVAANRQNVHTQSEYPAIDAIHRDCKPIWTKHGFSVSSSTHKSDIDGYIKVIHEVMHSGGFSKVYENDWPIDSTGPGGKANKTTIQGMVSAQSYARRTSEMAIFDIAVATTDKDGNGRTKPGKIDQ